MLFFFLFRIFVDFTRCYVIIHFMTKFGRYLEAQNRFKNKHNLIQKLLNIHFCKVENCKKIQDLTISL